jgi:hypothetical protein
MASTMMAPSKMNKASVPCLSASISSSCVWLVCFGAPLQGSHQVCTNFKQEVRPKKGFAHRGVRNVVH